MSSTLPFRVIPCLQLINESLVKTIRFRNPAYIGDPINTVRIFNELEVDELCFLDIRASVEKREPNYKILGQIADECFMPLAYGGGIKTLEAAKKILSIGFEKIVINSAAFTTPRLITEIADHFGSQAVMVAIDAKKNLMGRPQVYINDGTQKTSFEPVEWAQTAEAAGAGEILLTSIDREGTWNGFDVPMVKKVAAAVSIPLIANGGAGSIKDIVEVVKNGHASAVAAGSMVVYQKKGMGVLINFPDKQQLVKFFSSD